MYWLTRAPGSIGLSHLERVQKLWSLVETTGVLVLLDGLRRKLTQASHPPTIHVSTTAHLRPLLALLRELATPRALTA